MPRIAVVHEWLLDFAGSERVLREILEVLPQADLFTLIDLPDAELRAAIPRRAKATTFLQSLPRPKRWLRYYLPLMPLAVEQSRPVGLRPRRSRPAMRWRRACCTRPGQLHVSYVHSPMRYAWDLQHQYLRASRARPRPARAGWRAGCSHRLRQLGRCRGAHGVDVILANSRA